MIIKPQYIPMKLLATQALLNHLPPGYQQRRTIEDDLAKLNSSPDGTVNKSWRII